MKKSPKLYLLVGLALLVAGLLAVYLTVAVGQSGSNNVRRHLKAGTDPGTSQIDQLTCTTCHQRNWSHPKDAHKTHASGIMLAFYDKPGGSTADDYDGCGKCHQSTSVRSAYGEIEGVSDPAVRKQVDPQFCLTCHGAWSESTLKYLANTHLGKSIPTTNPTGCKAAGCHDTYTHSATWISLIYSNARAYCLKCHGLLQEFVPEETN